VETRFCTQCGTKLKPGARFCTACGAQIEQAPSSTRNKRRGKKGRRAARRQTTSPVIPILAGSVLLILAGILIFFSLNRSGPALSEVPDVHDEQGIPYPETPRISLTEAKARYDAGTAIFVDVRSRGEYETAHIINAISLPLADLDRRYRELPKDAEIITYCT